MKRIVMWSGAIIVVAAALTWVIEAVFAADGIELGFHGTVAVFLCLVIVPGLTIGLMWLAHVSDREGHDRAVNDLTSDKES